MKTIEEIKSEIELLEKKRIECLIDRDLAKNDCERDVAQNLVLIYVMQIDKLNWVLGLK